MAFVYNNRVYQNTQQYTVPYTNKELKLEFAAFRDKLKPGQKEEWQIKISGMKGDKVAAEMLLECMMHHLMCSGKTTGH